MLSSSAMSYVVSNEDETVVVPPMVPVTPEEAAVAASVVSPVDSPSSTVVIQEGTPEILDVAVAAEPDPVEGELAQVVSEQCALQERADELLDMQHALEHYSQLMRQTGLDGMTKDNAAFMQVGVKLIQKSLGTDVAISTESFDSIDPRSNRIKVTISSESVKELASKAYDMFMEAIKKLVALIKKGWEFLADYSLNLEKDIQKQRDRIKDLKRSSIDQELKVRNPTFLFADGEEVYPEVKGLVGLAHFAMKAYPRAMEQYFSKVGTYIKGLDVTDLGEEEVNGNIHAISKPLSDLAKDSTVKALFQGNYQVDIAEDNLSFGMKQADGKSAPAEVELLIPAPVKLRKQLDDIHVINLLLKDYRETNDKVHKAAEKLTEVASKFKNTTSSSVRDTVLSLVKDAAPRNREIVTYIVRVLRAYMAVTDQMISRYEAASKTK